MFNSMYTIRQNFNLASLDNIIPSCFPSISSIYFLLFSVMIQSWKNYPYTSLTSLTNTKYI